MVDNEGDPRFVLDRIELQESLKGLNDKLKHIEEEEEGVGCE
jgi:hypothetical protein